MAKIIPARPRGNPSKAFLAFYRVLKGLPDDFTAWLSLDRKSGDKPHVFLVWRECHAFLIQVAATSQQLAESALQGDFFRESEALRPEELGRGESELLAGFVRRAIDRLGPLAGELPLKQLIVFPNVSQGTVDEVVMLRSEKSEVSYLGLHQLQGARSPGAWRHLPPPPCPSPDSTTCAARSRRKPWSTDPSSPGRPSNATPLPDCQRGFWTLTRNGA